MTSKVFLHIGLQKTGTTFLQQQVFPRFEGVSYMKKRFRPRLLLEGHDTFLVSNEWILGSPLGSRSTSWLDDHRRALEKLGKLAPDTRLIVCFRRHSDLLVSLYKQYLHEGGTATIHEFFDPKSDSGWIKPRDLFFYPRIKWIEEHFQHRPFVFLFDEIWKHLQSLIDEMGELLGADVPSVDELDRETKNPGVRYYQGKLLRYLNKISEPLHLKNRWTLALGIDPRSLCQQRLGFLSERPIELEQDVVACIEDMYSEDWELVEDYVESTRGVEISSMPTNEQVSVHETDRNHNRL